MTFPKEMFYTTPVRGLDRPFLTAAIVLWVLGGLLLIAAVVWDWVAAGGFGLVLPFVGLVLALIYRSSDGTYHM